MTSSSSTTTASYRTLRRLPPFYTVQPNTQTQAKQLQCWCDFLLDCAVAAYKECGSLGITLHPHSAVFRSPPEVNRTLPSAGARAVLRAMMENHGGYRALPFAIETGDEDEEMALALAQQAEREALERRQKAAAAAGEQDEFDFVDSGASPTGTKSSPTTTAGAIFLNCDAVIVLALPCEKIVETMWKWHEEESTSTVFSVSELAEDKDLIKRIANAVLLHQEQQQRHGGGAGGNKKELVMGEPISLVGKNFKKDNHNDEDKSSTSAFSSATGGGVTLAPLTNEVVIEAIMTTEHPAMAHLKRPSLLSGSGGSLGLKFA